LRNFIPSSKRLSSSSFAFAFLLLLLFAVPVFLSPLAVVAEDFFDKQIDRIL
jgi:hypothetical protein